MVVYVRLLGVLALFLVQREIVAVGEFGVVVLVCMPEGAMLPFSRRIGAMVMGHVIVIVGMGLGRMLMNGLTTLPLYRLRNHATSPVLGVGMLIITR